MLELVAVLSEATTVASSVYTKNTVLLDAAFRHAARPATVEENREVDNAQNYREEHF